MKTVRRFDDAVESLASSLRGRARVDAAMYKITESANHSIIWHLINLGLLLGGRHDKKAALRLAAILGIESAVVNGVVKNLFRRSRPIHEMVHPHRLRAPKTTSFPSGHATSAFCAASILSQGRSPIAHAGWFGLAKLVAYTRIHVRIHHASDVVAGAALGLFLAAIAKILWPRQENP